MRYIVSTNSHMNNTRKSTILKGQIREDTRGSLKFFNIFDMSHVKRMYEVSNSQKEPVRAFHGHMKEEKYVFVVTGKILLCVAQLDKSKNPSVKIRVKKYFLTSENPEIVHIPSKSANGFKTLQKNTRVIFFSTLALKDSLKDDYRYPADYFGKEVRIRHTQKPGSILSARFRP